MSNIPEKIVRYFDGELSAEEKPLMEDMLIGDPALRTDFENLNLARTALAHYGYKAMVAQVHVAMLEEVQPPVRKMKRSHRKFRFRMAVAASILLVIGAFWMYKIFSFSSEKVFASHYQTYTLKTGTTGNDSLTPVERAYVVKNYTEVIRIHDEGLDKTAKGEFLAGMAFLEKDNNKRAIKCFHEVIDLNKDSIPAGFKDESEYYLALTHIKNKEYNTALTLLDKISADEKHTYYSEATSGLIEETKRLINR